MQTYSQSVNQEIKHKSTRMQHDLNALKKMADNENADATQLINICSYLSGISKTTSLISSATSMETDTLTTPSVTLQAIDIINTVINSKNHTADSLTVVYKTIGNLAYNHLNSDDEYNMTASFPSQQAYKSIYTALIDYKNTPKSIKIAFDEMVHIAKVSNLDEINFMQDNLNLELEDNNHPHKDLIVKANEKLSDIAKKHEATVVATHQFGLPINQLQRINQG